MNQCTALTLTTHWNTQIQCTNWISLFETFWMLIWIADSKTWISIFTIMKTGFLNIKGLKFWKINFYFIYYLYLKRKIQISSIKMPLSQSFDSCESFCFRQPLKLFIIIIKGKNFLFSCFMFIILLLFNLILYH